MTSPASAPTSVRNAIASLTAGPSHLVLIGSSTGGPRVLNEIMALLPPLPAAVLVVQHMPRFINPSLVRTLASNCRMPVCLAQDQQPLEDGHVYLAPSDLHCRLVHNCHVTLVDGPRINFVKPSIDVTMQSIRRPAPGFRVMGIILTGMGKDGAAGLRHVKAMGGFTIAQSEATCAVYGMPREAVLTGCVDHQLDPPQIAHRIIQSLLA